MLQNCIVWREHIVHDRSYNLVGKNKLIIMIRFQNEISLDQYCECFPDIMISFMRDTTNRIPCYL